jgi:hypothetical protein
MRPTIRSVIASGFRSYLRYVNSFRKYLDWVSLFQLDFWKAPKGVDNFVDVMVPPTMLDTLPPILLAGGLTYTITINDVQK